MAKNISSRIALAGLSAILASSTANSGIIKTTPHPQDLVWMADGNVHRMGVYAKNTGVSPGLYTDLVQWKINNHPTFSPLYNGFEIPPAEQDFFNGVQTENVINGLGWGSYRLADQFNGPLVNEGQGFLVYHNFTVPQNTQLGRYRFTLSTSTSNTYMTNEWAVKQQPVIIGADFITVIPDLNAMTYAMQGPEVTTTNPQYDFDLDGDVDTADCAAAQVESSQIRN